MADGTIEYAQFPISFDANAPADTARQLGLSALFPVPDHDIISTEIIQITGNNGVVKTVVLVTARDTN